MNAKSALAELTLSQRKRWAIMEAAVHEFDASGFQATSMDQIAARAQVSKRTVYNHFSSKQQLFEAIRSELFNQIASIDYEYTRSLPLDEQLTEIAARQVEILCCPAFMRFARISIPLSVQSQEVAKTTYREFHKSNHTALNWIKAAAEDGQLNVSDPQFAARQFLGLLNAAVFWPQMIGGQPSPSKATRRKVVEASVAMFLSQYTTESD